MNAETLIELAARCEAATGPSTELDALIRCALFAPEGAYVEQSPLNEVWCVYLGTYSQGGKPRLFERPRNVSYDQWRGAYTASLDAAMTLVPEGWSVADLGENWRAGGWRVTLVERPNEGQRRAFDAGRTIGNESEIGEAATPALALTAACLRARAAAEQAS